MKVICKKLFAIVLSAVSLVLSAQTVSEQRVLDARKIANGVLSKTPNATRDAVLAATRAALVKAYPALAQVPTKPIITEIDTLRDYDARFKELLDEKHPVLNDVQLEYLAAEKYPLYKRGDLVTVHYVRGNKIESWTGHIGLIEEGRVMVGSRKIFFNDMYPVAGNDVELLKFLPRETRKKRDAYKVEVKRIIEETREDFRLNQQREVEKELLAKDQRTNEANGYTYYQKQWLVPADFFNAVVNDAFKRAEDARYEALNVKLKERRQVIDAMTAVQDMRLQHELPGTVNTPALARLDELAEQQEKNRLKRMELIRIAEERERQEALAKAKREKEAAQAKAEAAAKAKLEKERLEKLKKAEEEALAKAKAEEEKRLARELKEQEELAAKEARRRADAERMEQERLAREKENEKAMGAFPPEVFAGIVVLVLAIGIGGYLLFQKRYKESDPFSKFFEGKGRLQKDFWSKAAADPEHFKYVAYMFPSLQDATKALLKLSYIKQGGSGELRCTRQLNFGVYPHLEGAVCFIGGVKFSYALWREASAVLPELPGAQYFKVSTEPVVKLDIPDLEKLQEKNLHVESLGVEDFEGENGEFNRLYKYRTPSRQEALDFLENFNIQEAGIIVHVETPDGILGKDENGVFTLEENVLDAPME